MIGGLRSIWGSFAGGIAIGIVEALIIWNYPVGGVLEVVAGVADPGQHAGAPRPRQDAARHRQRPAGRSRPRSDHSCRASPARPACASPSGPRCSALVVVAVLAPLAVRPSNQVVLTNIVLTAMMCMSLVVLTGYAGHVSLGQFAFVGIGAAAGGRLYQLGVPHLPAAIVVTLLGAVLAVVVGLPALRLRGLFLSVATLGLALATSSWLFYQEWFVHIDDRPGRRCRCPDPSSWASTSTRSALLLAVPRRRGRHGVGGVPDPTDRRRSGDDRRARQRALGGQPGPVATPGEAAGLRHLGRDRLARRIPVRRAADQLLQQSQLDDSGRASR